MVSEFERSPGTLLRTDYLEPLGISVSDFAGMMDVPEEHMLEIVNDRRPIDFAMADKLDAWLEDGTNFWKNLVGSSHENHRREKRRPALIAAHISDLEGTLSVPCIVRDTSKSGMRVFVAHPQEIPDQVTIEFNNTLKQFTCLVVWRSDMEVGLSITDRRTIVDSISKVLLNRN